MKISFSYIIIGVLCLIIGLQRCSRYKGDVQAPTITIKYDTIRTHDSVNVPHPYPVYVKGDIKWLHDTEYIPSDDYDSLKKQYITLGDSFFAEKTYINEFKLGEYGNAFVTDSIKRNSLSSISFKYNINVPEETITIKEPYIPKRQLYVGGGIQLAPYNGTGGVQAIGLYKDRQDRIFGVSLGYYNGINVGISTYWKIKLK